MINMAESNHKTNEKKRCTLPETNSKAPENGWLELEY